VIWLLTSAHAVEFLAAAGVLAISSLLYLVRRRRPLRAP
jgi:LPXTG-motif cell wall-anchored protein